jgi:NCAIR mutase (PurE)-related protein
VADDPPRGEPEHSTLDYDREARQGVPEVVYGPGKTVEQVADICHRLLRRNHGPVVVTRIEATDAERVQALVALPDGTGASEYDAEARLLCWRPAAPGDHLVAVVTAGTADHAVAAEAAATCRAFGLPVLRVNDVGVAGLHRVLARVDDCAGPTWWSSSRAWRALWRASAADSCAARSSPSRPPAATGPRSRA